jgi:hypothetical protein
VSRVALFFGVFALLLALTPREPSAGPVALHAATARALAARGTFDVADTLDAQTAAAPDAARLLTVEDGRRYVTLPPGAALARAPFEALALALEALGAPRASRFVVGTAQAALGALLALLIAVGLRRSLVETARARGSLLRPAPLPRVAAVGPLVVAAVLSTPLLVGARAFDAALVAALGLTIALDAARTPTRRWAAARLGLGAALAIVADPDLLPAASIVVAVGALTGPHATDVRGWSRGVARTLVEVLPPLAAFAAVLAHRRMVGGWPEPPGGLAEGLLGLLTSTGKGLIFFAPPLVLLPFSLRAAFREGRRDAALSTAVLVAALFGVAASPRWHGDPSYGPSRLLPIIPLAVELVGWWLLTRPSPLGRARRAGVAALVAAGVVVQLAGAALPPTAYRRVVQQLRLKSGAATWPAEPESTIHFIPQLSPIRGHLFLLGAMARRAPTRPDELATAAPWRFLLPQPPKLEGEVARLRLDFLLLGGLR